MKRQAKTIVSTRIEANKDKIYRMNDIHDLASLIFPNKNAKDLRAAFILIFLAIKYSQSCKITTLGLECMRKRKASNLSPKSLWKARAVMARIGFIAKREGSWQFSTKFGKSLQNLSLKTAQLIVPTGDREHEEKDWFLFECAKKN